MFQKHSLVAVSCWCCCSLFGTFPSSEPTNERTYIHLLRFNIPLRRPHWHSIGITYSKHIVQIGKLKYMTRSDGKKYGSWPREIRGKTGEIINYKGVVCRNEYEIKKEKKNAKARKMGANRANAFLQCPQKAFHPINHSLLAQTSVRRERALSFLDSYFVSVIIKLLHRFWFGHSYLPAFLMQSRFPFATVREITLLMFWFSWFLVQLHRTWFPDWIFRVIWFLWRDY